MVITASIAQAVKDVRADKNKEGLYMTFAMKMRDMQNIGYSEGYEDAKNETNINVRKEIAYRMFNQNMDIDCIAQIVDETPATVQLWIDSREQEDS